MQMLAFNEGKPEMLELHGPADDGDASAADEAWDPEDTGAVKFMLNTAESKLKTLAQANANLVTEASAVARRTQERENAAKAEHARLAARLESTSAENNELLRKYTPLVEESANLRVTVGVFEQPFVRMQKLLKVRPAEIEKEAGSETRSTPPHQVRKTGSEVR